MAFFNLMRIINILRRITAACVALGTFLLVGALLTIPILGFVSASIGAFGTWLLLLAALAGGLLLLSATVNRAMNGRWYFGEQEPVWKFLNCHRRGSIIVAGILAISIFLVLGWLSMH